MPPVREFGTRRFRPPPPPSHQSQERRSLIPALAGASAAFAVVWLAIVGWDKLPAAGQWMPSLPALFGSSSNGLDFSGDRIGNARTAPVLKMCLTGDVLELAVDDDFDPATLLQMLQASNLQSRVRKLAGAPEKDAGLRLAQMWGQVADCVYRQDGHRLCDIDNRALAVEAGATFVRQADAIVSRPETAAAIGPGDIQALTAVKERVLDGLRSRVEAGVLIASDFSPFAPATIRKTLGDVQPVRNDCAKK